MSGEDEASIRYYGVLKSMGDTYGFIKCRRTQQLYTRDVYITKSDLPDGGEVSKPVSFQVRLNDRGRPQAREVRLEENPVEESEDEQPEALQKAHSAPLPTVKSPPSSSPPRSMELKPLSAPIAPWADIVDDEDFEPLEVQTLQQPEVRVTELVEVKASIEEDDGLGEWGRRRRSMSLPEKPTKMSSDKVTMNVMNEVSESSPLEESSPTSEEQPTTSSTEKSQDGGNEETNGLLQRLLGAESDPQDEKNTQVPTPAVGLVLGAPPSAAKGQRWGGDSGDESDGALMQDMDMGALSPGSDAIWRAQDSDPFYQQVMANASGPMPLPNLVQSMPATMPATMPQQGAALVPAIQVPAMAPQTAMASMTQPTMMCEAPQMEGQSWQPWQNWTSWTENNSQTWQYNVPIAAVATTPQETQQLWPQDANMWQQNGETQQQQWQEPQQQQQTWQREPGHEILKQLGVTPAGQPEPPCEENLFLPEALWNRTDLVRALCFKRSRRFLLGAETDLMRLLKAPEGALLRIPKLAPLYQRLLRELCKRFRTREETSPTGEFIIRTTNASYAPLMPLAAFVPRTWGGSNPNAWEDRRRDPALLRGKHNMTPCPGLLVPPLQHLYDEFGPGAPGDDLGNLGGFGAHRWDMRESEQAQWDMSLLPKQWRFIELPPTQCSTQDDGMVVTVSLNLTQGGGGFGLALCEQGGAFQEPLCRLLDNIHGDGSTRPAQRQPGRGNFHVLLVQPSQNGPSPTGEPRWCLKLGHGEQAVQGEYADCRTVTWQDEGRTVTNSGKHSATFWLATYAGGNIQGLDDGGMLIEAGIGRFPWGKIFRARVQRCGVLRKVAVGALGRNQGTHLSAVSLESSVCPDLASREHVVKLFRNGKTSGGAAERSPWWLQPGKHGLVALFDGLAICESFSRSIGFFGLKRSLTSSGAEAALRLQRTAEECSNGAWQAKTLAGASIEEAVSGHYGHCGLQREQRATALLGLGRQCAIDLALDEWAAVAEASKKALLPDPPSMAPPPPPVAVPPPPPASQQPHWPTQTPPPPPPMSRLSADAPVFTPGGVVEAPAESKPALSCSALPFIPSESTRAMTEMASNMNASAEEFMPTLISQPEKNWSHVEEETWKEPWKAPPEPNQNWNDRKWNAQHEVSRYDDAEYMKGAPHYDESVEYMKGAPRYDEAVDYMKGDKGKGWGKGPKGKMAKGKGQDWPNNASWKGSAPRYNANHGNHGGHQGGHGPNGYSHRRPEWNDWEETNWEDWEEKAPNEAWRSQWRGAEPKPNKWSQERRNSNREQRQPPKQPAQRPPLRQRKYSDSTEVISSSSSGEKEEEAAKGRGRGGKGPEEGSGGAGPGGPTRGARAKLRRMWQQEREAERAARFQKTRQDEVTVESSPKAAVDIDKSVLLRHLGRR